MPPYTGHMPWTAADAKNHKSGLTDQQATQWAAVANQTRERCVAEGREADACDAMAIRVANGAVKEAAELTETEIIDLIESALSEPQQVDLEESPFFLSEADIAELQERVRRDGLVPIKIIKPGWGSSGYYGKDQLSKALGLFEGAHMYWDHPTATQARERPERSLKDLAAVVEGPVSYKENGVAGPGVYAQARVFAPYRESIAEMAPYIGISIRGSGTVRKGTAEGREGPIVESLNTLYSVDFVTKPGAGGRILDLFESSRGLNVEAEQQGHPEGGSMTELSEAIARAQAAETALSEAKSKVDERDRQLAEAKTQLEGLQTENARMREANLIREAAAFAGQKAREAKLPGDRKLPEPTVARIAESLSSNPPAKEDGTLDTGKLEEKLTKAIEAEVAYLTSIFGSGVTSMGGSTQMSEGGSNDPQADKAWEDSFAAALGGIGLNESAAKLAAGGR